MTKKARKQKTNRHHSAARRAKRAASRRAKRCHRDGARERRAGPKHYVTTALWDGTAMIREVSRAELGLHSAYLEAHRLLPRGYPSNHADVRAHGTWALRTLEDPLSPNESVLRAILILGHTPDERALRALRRHASRNRVYAGMARLAADECVFWMETSEPDRERPPQPAAMLN